MDFKKRYANLNDAQRQAVDTIDGPVIVIAGPGTGKTELLSVRTANILQKTDTLPENILCLTFTDSGANAMRERLAQIIGKEAYKVAVHTFHSFGSEIINQNGQYFYRGAHFRPADELSSYQIIQDIFEKLDYNNPLNSKLNGEYTYLPDSLTTISELKKSGLTSDELLKILDENNIVIEKTNQLLSPVFASKINKNTAAQAAKYIETIRQSNDQISLPTIVPLSQIIADSLQSATNQAIDQNSTKPITAWRNNWFKKDSKGNFVLKSGERQSKLRSLSYIYEKYLARMEESALYDFDDMILRVVHAMEVFDDLRFNLQEQYQYIMVDEFQDTNMAQMRILHNLTNNVVQGDTPNIMVVGDDDQAIYSFQGADISNIIDFRTNYPKAKLITLTENYRSSDSILSNSREVIIQGQERLENRIAELNKSLKSNSGITENCVFLHEAESIMNERDWLVSDIKARIKSGEKPNDIAVLTRRHHEINSLLPYFADAGIAVNYERRDNVLDQPPIILIEQLSRLLIALSAGKHDEVNAILPELLAHKAWEIAPVDIWRLSTKAYDNRSRWLDEMASNPIFEPIYSWIIETATLVYDTPLEQILDIIIGNPNSTADSDPQKYVSPIYKHYFDQELMNSQPHEYLTYLESVRAIRTKIKEYMPDQTPTLKTFVEFIALSCKVGNTIDITRRSVQSEDAVNVMTTHKSKGLEFNAVYIINAVDTVWGERARSRNRLISYPENLPLSPAGESEDERLRLFYVAMTRAKKQLHISYSLSDDNGKNTLRASFLVSTSLKPLPVDAPDNTEQMIKTAELAWYQPLIDPATSDMRNLLLPKLENYKLSVTHMHNFLDVSRGGPSAFLLQNLLHFPSAKTASAGFGTAIHDTLQKAHAHFVATGKKQAIEDIVSNFETNLKDQQLGLQDYEKYLQKGSDALRVFLGAKYDDFKVSEQPELNFSNQHSIVDRAHLTGKLDLVEIDRSNRKIIVTDYKTGKPSLSWSGKTEYEKIRLHKYKQQLLFYKLLVENARDYRGYSVDMGIMQFIEPTVHGEIVSIDTSFSNDELERFKLLVNAVWDRIIKLDLPDISAYEPNYKGILAFEQYLIDNNG